MSHSANAASVPDSLPQSRLLLPVLAGGMVAGTLDITCAFMTFGWGVCRSRLSRHLRAGLWILPSLPGLVCGKSNIYVSNPDWVLPMVRPLNLSGISIMSAYYPQSSLPGRARGLVVFFHGRSKNFRTYFDIDIAATTGVGAVSARQIGRKPKLVDRVPAHLQGREVDRSIHRPPLPLPNKAGASSFVTAHG